MAAACAGQARSRGARRAFQARHRLAPLLLSAQLAACGTGLYDASGVPPSDAGGALVCEAGLARCANACVVETAEQCGDACASCFDLVPSPPAHGGAACLAGTCGYACDVGYLKCDGGCCAATALAAAGASTCALLDDATVRCWGANGSGQLGDGTFGDRAAPVKVAPLPAAVALGVGPGHACAVTSGGAVLCWGANDQGQVTGATVSPPKLTPTATPIAAGATAVVAGAAHTCALLGSGSVKCWGADGLGQLGPGPGEPIPSGATSLAAGTNHTCALVGDAVKCWGDAAAGQLGGAPAAGLATPIGSGITLLTASGDQTCASTGVSNNTALDDVVRCWGSGIGAAFLPADPQPTPEIPLKQPGQATVRFDVSVVSAGRAHVCVRRTGELVSCFGAANDRGQLGTADVTTGPTEAWLVTGSLAAASLAAGADHTCARLGDGTVRCWGANDRGQLGNGATLDPPPGEVVAPSGR